MLVDQQDQTVKDHKSNKHMPSHCESLWSTGHHCCFVASLRRSTVFRLLVHLECLGKTVDCGSDSIASTYIQASALVS